MPRTFFTVEAGFVPTQPISGENNGSLYRGQNMIVRGVPGATYLENWLGISSQTESAPDLTLTGTVATTSGSTTVTGTSTLFLSELIVSQMVLINSRPYTVREIVSNTSMRVSQPATATASGLTIKAPRTLMDTDFFRASMVRGNVLRTAQGNLLAVGQGEVRLNGAVLAGTSLTATPQLKLAIYNPDGATYSVYKLGMKTPTLTTVAGTAGGTKNMQAGTYSVRIVPARIATYGYNNPSAAVEVTITTGQKIRITFPAMDTTAGQDAWRVYGTLFSANQGITGPWYYVDTVTAAHVSSAGGTYDFEWRDAEIQVNEQAEFDNDPPPAAAFVASLANYPILVSTNGPGRVLAGTVATTATSQTVTGTGTAFDTDLTVGSAVWISSKFYEVVEIASATSMTVAPAADATASGLTIRLGDNAPGPVIRPCKPAINGVNIEAYPTRFAVAVSPPETIIGWTSGLGRLYLMTENRLHIATLTGNSAAPVTVRPFWRVGFRNPQSCVFVNGYLYGFTTGGATRSIADGDEGSEEHAFAAPVASVMESWLPDLVRVAYDPKNEAVVFLYSSLDVNSSGYYNTNALMYHLRTGRWSTTIIMESTSANLTTTGVATVSGQFFLAVSGQTYAWDQGANTVNWFVVWPFFDGGDFAADKTVTGFAATCLTGTGGNAGIHGGVSGADVALSTALTDNTVAASGVINLPTSTAIKHTEYFKLNVKELRSFTARVAGQYTGTGEKHRIDELMVEWEPKRVRH